MCFILPVDLEYRYPRYTQPGYTVGLYHQHGTIKDGPAAVQTLVYTYACRPRRLPAVQFGVLLVCYRVPNSRAPYRQ